MTSEIVSVSPTNESWICMEKSRKETGRDLKSRPALHGFGLVFKSLQATRPLRKVTDVYTVYSAFSGVRDARSSLV